MAESEARPSTDQPVLENDANKLKYLDFVQVAAVYVIVVCSTIYEFAKENAGPLRPGVQTVEGTVKTVTRPVYEKFHNVPFELLKFVDRKVDDSISELDYHMPPFLKCVSRLVWNAAKRSPGVARELATEVERAGLVDTVSNIAKITHSKYEPVAKELYNKYEPVAEHYAVAAWLALNRLPLFSQVAHIMVPTAAYWAERYNQAVTCATQRGCAMSYYLPLVPIEKIAKTFEGAGNSHAPAGSVNGVYVDVSQ